MAVIEPFAFQRQGIAFLGERTGALLADDMGLGKTVQALLACVADVRGPVLVIARPLNKQYWARMIAQLDPEASYLIASVGGRVDFKTVGMWFRPLRRAYLIVHHEALRFIEEELAKHTWHCVIADEAHRFKNRNAKMTKALKRVPSLRRWALTGTPMEKSPADFWSLLNWFDPKRFNGYWKFFDRFVQWVPSWGAKSASYQSYGPKVILGVKDPMGLAAEVGPYYLRRSKADSGLDLPEKMYEDVPLEMPDYQHALYELVKKKVLVDLTAADPSNEPLFIANAISRIHYLTRVALDPSLLAGYNADPSDVGVKVKWLFDFAEDTDRPFVVFTHAKAFAHMLGDLIQGAGVITGDVSLTDRNQVLSQFDLGILRAIIGTTDTMSESVNLQRATTAIFTDIHPSSIAMTQAEDRVHRIGSVLPVTIIRLNCIGTVDELFLQRLQKKWSDRQLVEAFLKGDV